MLSRDPGMRVRPGYGLGMCGTDTGSWLSFLLIQIHLPPHLLQTLFQAHLLQAVLTEMSGERMPTGPAAKHPAYNPL